jgi:hypothetical protein
MPVYATQGLKFGFQTGYSLWIFPPLHPVRVLCMKMVFNRKTHWFILMLILLSCFCVAMDRPGLSLDEQRLLSSIGSVTNFIFFLEFLLKVVGLSLEEYIASRFNMLDSFIVATSLVDEFLKYFFNPVENPQVNVSLIQAKMRTYARAHTCIARLRKHFPPTPSIPPSLHSIFLSLSLTCT